MGCYRLFLLCLLIVTLYCKSALGQGHAVWQHDNTSLVGKLRLHRSFVTRKRDYKPNITLWKYPHSSLNYIGLPAANEYEDEYFGEMVGALMSISHEDDEEYYPFGMYPYLFAGINPYQFGQCESGIFQKEALLKNATKTNMETILSISPFLVYIFLWIYVEFLAILILPLVGFILFRFVALPLGELIGGRQTRTYLRGLVINIEKSRRDWVRWLWPVNRKLPPWRYRTPKILRHDNEGEIPWELMEEKEVKKLNMQYPQRWQINKRLQKWKEKATNPECYAEKWVFKMIHRKLLRDRHFHQAPHKYKWGDSASDTSSGTSTSSESDPDIEKTVQPQESNNVFPGRNASIDSRASTCTIESKSHFSRDYKKRKRSMIFTNKRTFVDELRNLKSSHRGIILDQRDEHWPLYTGPIYFGEEQAEKKETKYTQKGWNYLQVGLGSKQHFEKLMKKWKPKRTALILKKREIDALARKNALDSSKVTYNLAILETVRPKIEESPPPTPPAPPPPPSLPPSPSPPPSPPAPAPTPVTPEPIVKKVSFPETQPKKPVVLIVPEKIVKPTKSLPTTRRGSFFFIKKEPAEKDSSTAPPKRKPSVKIISPTFSDDEIETHKPTNDSRRRSVAPGLRQNSVVPETPSYQSQLLSLNTKIQADTKKPSKKTKNHSKSKRGKK